MRIQIATVDVELEHRHLLAFARHDERVEYHILHRPQAGQLLVVALEVDTERGVLAHLKAAPQHLIEARLPARRGHVRQKAELAEVDTQDRAHCTPARAARTTVPSPPRTTCMSAALGSSMYESRAISHWRMRSASASASGLRGSASTLSRRGRSTSRRPSRDWATPSD